MTRIIARAALQGRIQANPELVLLEALPEGTWRKAHLPGALNLPHDRVRELAPRLLPDKVAEIVTYCASATCQNSHIAAATLAAMGYGNVSAYAEGKQDWIEAGLPVETGGSGEQAA